MATDQQLKSNVWLDEEGHLFQYSGQCPAPSKDFAQVVVSLDQVIYRWWKISARANDHQRLNPGEIKESHEDFIHDETTQMKISCAFGKSMADYVVNLCKGKLDYLNRLPDKAILKLVSYLDLQDIGRMSQVSKKFHRICDDDELWRLLFAQIATITDELSSLAKQKGWKALFFSDKLKIQLELSRKRKREQAMDTSPPIPRVTRSRRLLSK